MMQQLWKLIRIAAWSVGGLFLFFTIMELLRAYVTLRALHPVAGTVFALAIVTALAAAAIAYASAWHRYPRVMRPPAGVDADSATGPRLRAYARFQRQLLRRLATNPALAPALQDSLRLQAARLREALAAGGAAADLPRTVRDTEADFLTPALVPLDAMARAEVAHSVRDVMLGVTLSPWRTVDLLVVLYRNVRMTLRVAAIYNARPHLREQALILHDVFTVVVTVNFLSYGSQLFQRLTTSVPVLGRFADDLAEGVGAGLLTSVTGHAAVGRCRVYGRWDAVEAERSIHSNLRNFLADVKRICIDDVLYRLRQPLEAQIPEAQRSGDVQARVRAGVAAALDDTATFLDVFVMKPAVATGRGVVGTGAALGRGVARSGHVAGRLLRRTGHALRASSDAVRRRFHVLRRPAATGNIPAAGSTDYDDLGSA